MSLMGMQIVIEIIKDWKCCEKTNENFSFTHQHITPHLTPRLRSRFFRLFPFASVCPRHAGIDGKIFVGEKTKK